MNVFDLFRKRQKHLPSKLYYAAVGDKVWVAYIPGTKHEIGTPKYKAEYARAIRALRKRLNAEQKARGQ